MDIAAWLAPLALGVFGLLFGSFANVVIWRFPRGESLSFPPSRCPSCETPIAWYDNVPVASWLLLKGRCRSCQNPISARYPLVECLSGVLWVAMWFVYGATLALPFAIVYAYLLMILAFIDMDTMRLPNPLVGLLFGVGLAGVVTSTVAGEWAVPLISGGGALSAPWLFAVAGLVVGGAIPLALSAGYAALRGREGMGMGDVKLLGVMGVYLGLYVVVALLLGSIAGALSALWPAEGGVRRKIPFGPFLAVGGVLTLAAGPSLWAWYSSLL